MRIPNSLVVTISGRGLNRVKGKAAVTAVINFWKHVAVKGAFLEFYACRVSRVALLGMECGAPWGLGILVSAWKATNKTQKRNPT